MTETMFLAYAAAFTAVFSAILKLLLGRALAQIDRRFDALERGQADFRERMTNFQIKVSSDYVTRTECQAHRKDR